MPKSVPSQPYLICKKKKTGLFSGSNDVNYQWNELSSSDASNGTSISLGLKALVANVEKRFYINYIELVKHFTKKHLSSGKTNKHPLTLSIEHLGGAPENPFKVIEIYLGIIEVLLKKNYQIAINFSEIFYVPEGMSPPDHYRAGIDRCVSDLEAYREGRQSFAYQFAKAIISTFRPKVDKKATVTDNLIINHYATFKAGISPEKAFTAQNIPLTELPCFDHPIEAFVSLPNSRVHQKSWVVLNFSSLVNTAHLNSIIRYFYLGQSFISELVITFRGDIYEQAEKRNEIYQEVKRIIDELGCSKFLHIILLSEAPVSKTLAQLMPTVQFTNDAPFSNFANGEGFYLTAPDIFTKITRTIYDEEEKGLTTGVLTSLERTSFSNNEKLAKKAVKKGYVFEPAAIGNLRPSKLYNKHQLRSQITLAFNHEQELQQMQALNQNQELARQQDINQQREHSHEQSYKHDSLIPSNPISFFLIQLQEAARKKLKKWTTEKRAFASIYNTSYYRTHYSKLHNLEALESNKEFGIKILGRVFGLAHTKYRYLEDLPDLTEHSPGDILKSRSQDVKHLCQNPVSSPYELIPLPNYSCESFEYYLLNPLINHVVDFSDGINPNARHIGYSRLWRNRLLQGWDDISPANDDEESFLYSSSRSSLSLLIQGYQGHLNLGLLLPNVSLKSLSKRKELVECAQSLLELFKVNPEVDIAEKKNHFFLFIDFLKFNLNKKPQYLAILNKLFSVFDEHNIDNLRILVQLIISGRRDKFEFFLNFLIYLDERSLLRNFYKIYFKYTPTVFSLVKFFEFPEKCRVLEAHSYGEWHHVEDKVINEHVEAVFLELVKQTPMANSPDDWPLYEQFCHALLVFAAKSNIKLIRSDLKAIEQFWCRISAKFFAYCNGDGEERDLLLKRFVTGLVTEDGLALARLAKLETLLTCLENLLDHCMVKHTLREQLGELSGISLAWIDVPYATAYNDFHIVSSDMKIESGSIGYGRNSYAVSLSELKTIIQNHACNRALNDPSLQLKTALLRYLAKESFREELSFYRKLIEFTPQNPQEVFLHELIVAFYVSTNTGETYTSRLAQLPFVIQCKTFLLTHSQAKTLSHLYDHALTNFFNELEQIKIEQQEGSVNLWMLWREKNVPRITKPKTELPAILAQKFTRKNLSNFLLQFEQEIKAALPVLCDEPMLAYALINNQQALNLLQTCYPSFGMKDLFDNLLDVLVFTENFRLMPDPEHSIFLSLFSILSQHPDINLAIALTKLCAQKLQEDPDLYKQTATFLDNISQYPSLLPHLINLRPALELMLDYYLSANIKNLFLPFVLGLCETLKGQKDGLSEGDLSTFGILLKVMQNETGYAFFLARPFLKDTQLSNSARLIQQIDEPILALSFIARALQEDKNTDFDALIACLVKMTGEHLRSCIFLSNWLSTAQHSLLLQQLEIVKAIPPKFLPDLMRLCRRHSIAAEVLSQIISSQSISDAIDEFERGHYEDNQERYQYDREDIAKKISLIQQKSWTDDPHQDLSANIQEKLLEDYEHMMDCMLKNPVLIENDEEKSQSFTIYQLSSRQFPLLFNELQKKITRGENKQQNQLLLLALCSEALYRTCGKFPRSTQLLSLMHSLTEEGHLIQEIKTGEGKSIIAAFHAVLLAAEGKTVNIVTENEQLARDGIRVFKAFYHYLGIHCGANIIEAQSPQTDYVANGINYSTPYSLALFCMGMDLKKIKLPKNRVLVWDEVDASLTATVQFRLATTLDPLLLETKKWKIVYKYLLSFVEEKDLFLENKCDKEADVHNFRHYCLLRNAEKDFTAFINKVDNELLSTLIDSARVAEHLEVDVDYVMITREGEKKGLYAAPILPHTNRAEPRASFAEGVQQLLHTRHNSGEESSSLLEIEPGSETLITLSAKNFFDCFSKQGGRCVGITGTAGSSILLKEFYQEHGFVAVNYPSFHEDLCEDLGIFAAEGWEDQKEVVLSFIHKKKETDAAQPILIICESPQAAASLCEHITNEDFPWTTQSYYGYDKPGFSEETFIHEAGFERRISIATKADSRGADFATHHKNGFLVINLCTLLTEEELRQTKGRAGRNGNPGQVCSIIDVLKLNLTKNDTPETIRIAFEKFQRMLCLSAQKERLKTRLLEDARHHVVNDYYIKLRAKADKILTAQEGRGSSLVNAADFMKTLRDFNQNTEMYYASLLEKEPELSQETKSHFLEQIIAAYNRILEHWLPADKFSNYKTLEPEIPLEKLFIIQGIDDVKLAQLTLFSELLSKVWEEIGHQNMTQLFAESEGFVSALDLYSNGEKGMKTIVAEFLLASEQVKFPELIQHVVEIQKQFNEFMDEFPTIPYVDALIPKQKIREYFNNYLTTTKTQIEEKNWEEISLPAMDKLPLTSGGMLSKGIVKTAVKVAIMPKLMKTLESYINDYFANDNSTRLTLLKALKDLKNPIIDFICAIPFSLASTQTMWALVFDKLIPILNHKGMRLVVEAFKGEALLEAAIKFIKVLEPYQQHSLPELISLKTLLPLLQKACQFDLIQQLIKNSAFKDIFNQISALDPAFFAMFDQFNFVSLFNFVQALAHPQFFNFLKRLPMEASFEQLKMWLRTNPENTPPIVRLALEALGERMLSREQIAEKNRLKLLNLKERFTLSPEKLEEGLQALKPLLPPENLPEEEKIVEPEEPLEVPLAEAPVIPEKQKSRFWLKVGCVIAAVIIGILFSWIIIPLAIASAAVYLSVVLFSKLKSLFCFNKPEPVPLPIEEKMLQEEPYIEEEASDDEMGIEPVVVNLSSPNEIVYDISVNNEEDASSIMARMKRASKSWGKKEEEDSPSIAGSPYRFFSLPGSGSSLEQENLPVLETI